ncbi:hypothetical protein Acr_00g0019580 [Actinidia rufa]|uniref:Uncharacterized protein n=1 Tax=Actinidia rufa TaxID=165716 RepID=A0A7J0DC25_9ERIC|nr:hypothetical protein Acr_00g0019580 [Actinidia rufa]
MLDRPPRCGRVQEIQSKSDPNPTPAPVLCRVDTSTSTKTASPYNTTPIFLRSAILPLGNTFSLHFRARNAELGFSGRSDNLEGGSCN